MKKKLQIALGSLVLLMLVYILGPRPSTPVYKPELPSIPPEVKALEQYIREKESKVDLREGSAASIIWADSSRKKSPYSIVYLHGFTATHFEGNPAHRQLAKRYGCNLYLARLAGHGRKDPDAMLEFTPENFWKSVKEAFVIGKSIGEKVIVIGTSTGGTGALLLGAQEYPELAAIINYSPNIRINQPMVWMANNPWGLQVLQLISQGDYMKVEYDEVMTQHWYSSYRVESVMYLQEIIESAMQRPLFEQIRLPVLNAYYYKDEQAQDPVVKVGAIRWMHRNLGTPKGQRREFVTSKAGHHVIACDHTSRDVSSVVKASELFLEEQLGLKPKP